jgi:hypothetical protein
MLSDTDAAVVAVALSLFLEKGKETPLGHRVLQMKSMVHEFLL